MTIAITHMGMVTNVGHDVATSCAALRAGLSRFLPIGPSLGLDEDELGAPVVGAPVRPMTDGFVQTGCWTRLALASLEDLLHGTDLPRHDPAFWNSTAIHWVLPLVSDDRFGWSEEGAQPMLDTWCAATLGKLLDVPIESATFLCTGHAGAVGALEAARTRLDEGLVERVLLIATDSWIDPMAVPTLIGNARLKLGAEPLGMIPGEAGACLLLERANGGAASHPLALVGPHRVGASPVEEPDGSMDDVIEAAQEIGRAWSTSILEALGETAGAGPFRGDVVLDLNGEAWRSTAWGHAQVLLGDAVDWSSVRTVIPASSFGDIGAASGASGLCIAAESFRRSYATSDTTLVCGVSDKGQPACVVLQRAT